MSLILRLYICSKIQLGEDLNGIFDDRNFLKTLSRFQVKYPQSPNPYKCFPPSRLFMSPPGHYQTAKLDVDVFY